MESILSSALATLYRGGTLLYPTDTIWGLGCDATDNAAVEKIYALKQRDHSKSMLVLCADIAMVERFISPVEDDVRSLLLEGNRPTTVIMPLHRALLADNLAASDGTIGVRVPCMEFCQRLLQRLGKPVVSTSANLSGQPSPSSFSEISPILLQSVDYCVPESCHRSGSPVPSRIVKRQPDGSFLTLRQ